MSTNTPLQSSEDSSADQTLSTQEDPFADQVAPPSPFSDPLPADVPCVRCQELADRKIQLVQRASGILPTAEFRLKGPRLEDSEHLPPPNPDPPQSGHWEHNYETRMWIWSFEEDQDGTGVTDPKLRKMGRLRRRASNLLIRAHLKKK